MNEEEQRSISALSKSKLNIEVSKNLEGMCPLRWEAKDGSKDFKLVASENVKKADIIKELFGTQETELATETLIKGIMGMPDGVNVLNMNVCTQILSDCKPKDAIEASLILQANTLYSKGMFYLERASNENMIPQADYYLKNSIKLLRLRNETLEALSRYRRGGEQRVIVQHVNVNQGGQAVVCGVSEGGGGAA